MMITAKTITGMTNMWIPNTDVYDVDAECDGYVEYDKHYEYADYYACCIHANYDEYVEYDEYRDRVKSDEHD